jgi:hypothetical protein
MVSIGRAVLVVIFILACIGIVQIASAAGGTAVDISLRANESFASMAFHGDRMYVAGYHIINYKAMGEVFIYDRSGGLITTFNTTPPDNSRQYDMRPYGIYANDDGSITVMTMDLLQSYGQDGTLQNSIDIRKYRTPQANGVVYTLPTGLASDGQYYYFGDSPGRSVLKVGKDGSLAGSFSGINVTRSLFIKNGDLYVGSVGENGSVFVLDNNMNKIAEYPVHLYMDYMGSLDDFTLIVAGPTVYVYDRNMSLFKTVNAIPYNKQVYGISQSGGDIGFVTMDHTNRTIGSLYVMNGTLFTTKSVPEQPKSTDPAPLVGAVVAGAGLGFLGIFFGKVQSFLNGLYESLLERLPKALKKFYDAIIGYIKGFLKSKIFKQESRLYKVTAREHVPLIFGFSSLELLVIAVGSVLLAASYVLAKGASLGLENIVLFLVSGVVAMVAHDIAHRYLARKYNAVTEYQFWWLGSIIMFITAIFFGVVYAVPARTIINNSDKLDKKVKGIVYLAGPMVSFAFAIFFLLLSFLGGPWTKLGLLGVSMNLLSSVYGLMPFNPMDGKKVIDWRGAVWAVAFIPVLIVYVLVTLYIA